MWLLSMNQRRCGSALPYFLLCFLEHPGIAQPQQAQQGWRLGPVPSAHPRRRQLKGGQPWVMGVPQKGGFEEECEAWPPRGRCWRGGKGKEKVLGGGETGRKRCWAAAAGAQQGELLLSHPCPPAHPAHRRGTALLPCTTCPPGSPHHRPDVPKPPEQHCKREGRQSRKLDEGRASPKDSGDKARAKSVGSGTRRKGRTSALSEMEGKIMKRTIHFSYVSGWFHFLVFLPQFLSYD